LWAIKFSIIIQPRSESLLVNEDYRNGGFCARVGFQISRAAAMCYDSCTGCQSVSALCSRSQGSYISRLVDWLPRTSQTTVAFRRTLAVAHCGPTPMTCGSCFKLLVPRTHNKLGDRSFSAAGPRLWNDLPPGLRRPGLTFDSIRQSLKTHLFGA